MSKHSNARLVVLWLARLVVGLDYMVRVHTIRFGVVSLVGVVLVPSGIDFGVAGLVLLLFHVPGIQSHVRLRSHDGGKSAAATGVSSG